MKTSNRRNFIKGLMATGAIGSGLGLQITNASVSSLPNPDSYYAKRLDYHKRQDGNVPEGSYLFVGDSLVDGCLWESLAWVKQWPAAVNYGIGLDTTKGVLSRLKYYQSLKVADGVLIHIGVNDMKFITNDELLSQMKAIVAKARVIAPAVPVIFSAIHPIDTAARLDWAGRSNVSIIDYNQRLLELAASLVNVRFVNAREVLVDSFGELRDDYQISPPDGAHLNCAGNKAWMDYLSAVL